MNCGLRLIDGPYQAGGDRIAAFEHFLPRTIFHNFIEKCPNLETLTSIDMAIPTSYILTPKLPSHSITRLEFQNGYYFQRSEDDRISIPLDFLPALKELILTDCQFLNIDKITLAKDRKLDRFTWNNPHERIAKAVFRIKDVIFDGPEVYQMMDGNGIKTCSSATMKRYFHNNTSCIRFGLSCEYVHCVTVISQDFEKTCLVHGDLL